MRTFIIYPDGRAKELQPADDYAPALLTYESDPPCCRQHHPDLFDDSGMPLVREVALPSHTILLPGGDAIRVFALDGMSADEMAARALTR